MDKKGQTLILFVILIPVILTMLAIVVDVGLLTNEYQRARSVIDEGIKEYFETQQVEEITNLLELNEVPTNQLEIEEKNDTIEVHLSYQMESFFGKLVSLTHYPIEIYRVGTKKDGEVILKKKEEKRG